MFSKSSAVKSLVPVKEVPNDGSYCEPFPLEKLHSPVLTGTPLKLFVALAEGPLFDPVRYQLLRKNKVLQILEKIFIPEEPTFRPNTVGWPAEGSAGLAPLGDEDMPAADRAAAAATLLPNFTAQTTTTDDVVPAAYIVENSTSSNSSQFGKRRRHYTAADYYKAYTSGERTPSQVAENIIAAVAASEAMDPPMHFLIAHDPKLLRQHAAASTQRWQEGRPLSPLDGVPFAVKDSCDALPYPTTAGTGFMVDWRTPTHSLAGVHALLDAGAMLIGKATLHEIGLGTTGLNIITGTARNPHSVHHHTGGSSSGSAALVAAGICPLAVGSDGGGSIRIPAAACGVVGLKPTHERVGTIVGTPPIDHTVAVLGPIAASIQDCALMYSVMANTGQRAGQTPPPVLLPSVWPSCSAEEKSLAGRTAGIDWEWFEQAEPAVQESCRSALSLLEEQGLWLVPIHLPELALLRAAHACTITSEMRNNMTAALQDASSRRRMNSETRVSLAVAAGFTSAHYLQAQKIRTRVEAHFRAAFSQSDFIITPSLPCTAPPIKPAAQQSGESDLTTTTALMQYVLAPNFIGLPAISIPVGTAPSTHAAAATSSSGGSTQLPVALHIMAPCWHEASLLHLGAVLEAAVAAAEKAVTLPCVWFDVLAAAGSAVPDV